MPHGSVHKVVVSFGNGSPVKYNLLRGVKLQTQIDLLLQLLKAPGNHESYALQLLSNNHLLSEEVL